MATYSLQSAIFDTMVIDPSAKSLLYVKAAQQPLGAAALGEAQNSRGDRCKQQDYLFFPVVLEAFGGLGVRCRDLVDKIDEEGKLNGVNQIHGMRIKTFLLRAIGFCLQSGNAFLAIHGSKRSRKRLQ